MTLPLFLPNSTVNVDAVRAEGECSDIKTRTNQAMPATKELPIPEKERYTYDDYQQLPEGAPYELIQGQLVRTPAPSVQHQRIVAALYRALDTFVRDTEDGEVFFAPTDVRLDEDTVVQPDVLFVAAEHADRVGTQEIGGPPDVVMEVVSPTNSHHDLLRKKTLYEQYDVPEYWIVDPESRTVEVFRNTDGGIEQHARAVERGTAASALLEDFTVDLDALFEA